LGLEAVEFAQMKRMFFLLALALYMIPTTAVAQQSGFKPGVPVIVNETEFINQTAPLPATTIFTPTLAGTYRVSSYVEFTSLTSVQWEVCASLQWTDDSVTQQVGYLSSAESSGGVCGAISYTNPNRNISAWGSVIIHPQAGSAVNLTIEASFPAPGAPAYSVYITIERLSPRTAAN
jgi:hypothetical protein